jgi:hypothetical protein
MFQAEDRKDPQPSVCLELANCGGVLLRDASVPVPSKRPPLLLWLKQLVAVSPQSER